MIIKSKLILIREILSKNLILFASFNLLVVAFQIIYTLIRYTYINSTIPFFYTKQWGEFQLAPKHYIFLIPITGALIIPFGVFFYYQAQKYFLIYADKIILIALTLTNLLFTASLLRIIHIASSPFEYLINPMYIALVPPFTFAFLFAYLTTPKFIEALMKNGIVTNPQFHLHPGMILKKPSARGGGIIFVLAVLVASFIFVGTSRIFIGIYAGALVLALLGLLDDYQNTNPQTKLRLLENPVLRLVILFVTVLIPIYAGIKIDFVGNPFDGIFNFANYTVQIAGNSIPWLSILFTAVWIVWVLNLLSWSNGVDGQYGGIVGIACIVIAILALRFDTVNPAQMGMAKLAVIAAGAAFGMTRYTWFPSKIMWGFGATAAGLVIATTSIVVGGKIAISTIIILLPFLDASVTFLKRILQGRNPLKADKGHLHHLLLNRGWSVQKIALFYWSSTAVSGIIGVISANRNILLITLTLAGVIAFFIVALNVSAGLKKKDLISRIGED